MFYSKTKIIATLALWLLPIFIFSQSAKKFYNSGETFKEAQNYPDAITSYTKALEIDPQYEKAYSARAFCYEKVGKKVEAAEDYKRAIAYSPKDKELLFAAGKVNYDLGRYADADPYLKQAIERDKDFFDAVALRVKVLAQLKNFKEGLAVAEAALDNKRSCQNYFNRAVMLDSMKNYAAAEKDYKDSKYYDSKFMPAYIGLVYTQLHLGKLEDAMATCEAALTKEQNNRDIYLARSTTYAKRGDFSGAMNDLSKVLLNEPNNKTLLLMRADYNLKIGQTQSAINDLTKVIAMDDKNIDLIKQRAQCYEQLGDLKAAAKDYEKILTLAPNKENIQGLLKEVKAKLFEFNRETIKPEIKLTSPAADDKNNVKLAGDQNEFIFKGQVKDGSLIKSVTINNTNADFSKDSLNPTFIAKVNMLNATEIVVNAIDVYDNTNKNTYSITRTEINKPVLKLIAPVVNFDNEIYLDNTNPELYIEGKVSDESYIESIIVNGISASYQMDMYNPAFSTKVSIANKDKITIKVRDVYGNEAITDFRLNRDGAMAAKQNPMGTTWVIFIENANYQNFSSLEGPTKDVIMMKSALANYSVNKIVHKKNMSKAELEKFFSIELRDLVRANHVTSLLLWYAGHGKFVNQTGYWIPVDAKVDDEFTYFSINNLKAAMQAYQKVVHTLVITDACESGPSFYLAMRDTPKERRCDNWESTDFKSAQVLSSAGYELAADNSQFTRTFAAALTNNPDACISIEKITEKVAAAVKQNQPQAPRLGKINGLEDEDGTFFFMKK